MERSRTAIARPVPILRYLCVDPRPSDSSISIDAVLFGDQMDALIDRDFIPLTIQHLATAIRFDAPLPTRSVLITFDQGLTGFYRYALPALRHRDIPSTVFVTSGIVGRESRTITRGHAQERSIMSWQQLNDLRTEDVLIGSNGHSHRPLDLMSRWEAGEDLALSRSLLEHQLERSVTTVAYPSGFHSSATKAAALRVGYTSGCGLQGVISSNYDDPFSLSRMHVDGTVRPEVLIARLAIAARRERAMEGQSSPECAADWVAHEHRVVIRPIAHRSQTADAGFASRRRLRHSFVEARR